MSVEYVGFPPDPQLWLTRFRARRVRRGPLRQRDLQGALIDPFADDDWRAQRRAAGVYDAAGALICEAAHRRYGRLWTHGGAGRPRAAEARLGGRSFFLGWGFIHFGHFLTETVTRLAALTPEEAAGYDHFVVIPWRRRLPGFAMDILAALGVADRVRFVTAPTSADHLTVTEPVVELHAKVHECVAGLAAHVGGEEEPDEGAVFLSRAGLGRWGEARMVVGEAALERALAAAGVAIVRPETLPLPEQVAALRRHRTVIGFAGSALHTLLLAGGGKRVFAYTDRAPPPVFPLIDRALDNDAVMINARRRRLPGVIDLDAGFKPQLIDPAPVLRALAARGVISAVEAEADDAAAVRDYNTAMALRRFIELNRVGRIAAEGAATVARLKGAEIDWAHIRAAAARPNLRWLAQVFD